MHIRLKSMAVVAAITVSWFMGAYAQSSSFFGASSSAATSVPPVTPSQPSPSQVWSKDDFAKKTGALKSQNDAQYKQNFNSKLKPMPTQGGTSSAPSPVPAGSSPTSAPTPAPAPTPEPAPTPKTPASTGSGYTGFANPNSNSNSGSSTTPSTTKSSGWGVTY